MNSNDSPGGADERRAKYAVPALEKGLDVVELLAEEAVPLTQAQICRKLDRQPSEIFRMLTCLEARGWLRREAETGAYALTLRLFELSRTHSPYDELLKAAAPSMRRLTETLRESCHLSVLHRDELLVLAQEESSEPFRLSVKPGSRHSPLRTTSGRLLLANMSETDRNALLARSSEWSRTSPQERDAFFARLEAIRQRGFEEADGERFVGGLDLGALVGAERSSIKAALTITTLKRADGPDLAAMRPTLLACAAAIAAQAGLVRPASSGAAK